MAKFVCSICGYTHEGSIPPEKCPVCLASASEFSEIMEAQVVEDIKDEATDESVSLKNCANSTKDSVMNNEVDKTFKDNNSLKKENNVFEADNTNNTGHIDENRLLDPDEEEILNQYNITHGGILQVVKWYKEEKGIGLKEAKDRVESVLIKHNLREANKGGSGCVVTILVAITSTLSLFYFL